MRKPVLACPNAGRYLARRAPRCGCVSCQLKWLNASVARIMAFMEVERQRKAWEEYL